MTKTPYPSKVHFSALSLENLDGVSGIVQPVAKTQSVTLESSATMLVTDFSVNHPHTLPTGSSIAQAQETMKQAGVGLLMLIDTGGKFTGVINTRELIGGRRITLAMQKYQIGRNEVTAEMIQTPRSELHSLSYAKISHASVGDLIQTLKTSGDQHVLITEPDGSGASRIRGIISASNIRRALGVDLHQPPSARTFSSICQVILGRDL